MIWFFFFLLLLFSSSRIILYVMWVICKKGSQSGFFKLIHTSVSQQQKTTENPTSSSALPSTDWPAGSTKILGIWCVMAYGIIWKIPRNGAGARPGGLYFLNTWMYSSKMYTGALITISKRWHTDRLINWLIKGVW